MSAIAIGSKHGAVLNWLFERSLVDTLFYSISKTFNDTLQILERHCGFACRPYAMILGLGFVLFCCSQLQMKRKIACLRPENPLQALLTVLTPTRSVWPPAYTALADRAKDTGHNIIDIPLRQLLGDVCAGTIEFRDVQRNLCDLFRDQLQVYGRLIRLRVGYSDWITLLYWISSSTLRGLMHSSSQCKTNFSTEDTGSLLNLDYLPYGHLEGAIYNLQFTLSPGSSFAFEFTTLGPSVKFLDQRFVLCAIPFLPRKCIQSKDMAPRRSAAPLLTSLHRVIELATSGPSPLTVDAVHNVAIKYATDLDSAAHNLEVDRRTRSSFIEHWGGDCWREHRLLSAWESSLLRTGYLMRWIVVVHR